MITIIGVAVFLIAAFVGGALFFRNNREKADKVVDKSEKIIDVLKS
jgi:hypothetical protein